MEIQNKSDLKLENSTETKKTAKLNLDLDVQDIMQVEEEQEIGQSIKSNKNQIKSNIFNLVRNQVLPDVINEKDDQPNKQETKKETPLIDVDNNFHATTNFVGGKLNAISNMQLTVDIESDEPISETEALSESIDVIASNIAETLYHNLDEIHNGTRGFNVDSSWNETDYHSMDKVA
jgi:hypothetical protein